MSTIDTKILKTRVEKKELSVLENENFMQILNYLEVLRSKGDELNMAKLNAKLSDALSTDKNEEALINAKNLDELLSVVKNFNLDLDNLRIESLMDLRQSFPNLAKSNFL